MAASLSNPPEIHDMNDKLRTSRRSALKTVVRQELLQFWGTVPSALCRRRIA